MSNFGRKRTVFVYADWAGLDGPVRIGTLFAELLRGKEVFSFSYDGAWLKRASKWQNAVCKLSRARIRPF